MGPFEEEEEGTGIASDVVKVQGEDLDTPGHLGGGRVRLVMRSDVAKYRVSEHEEIGEHHARLRFGG